MILTLVIRIFEDISEVYVRIILELLHQDTRNLLFSYNHKDKADLVNNKFYLVFTHEDLTGLPQCADSPYAYVVTFQYLTSCILSKINGILNLLNSPDINKASGSDNVSARVLVSCAPEIAPVATDCFIHSILQHWQIMYLR